MNKSWKYLTTFDTALPAISPQPAILSIKPLIIGVKASSVGSNASDNVSLKLSQASLIVVTPPPPASPSFCIASSSIPTDTAPASLASANEPYCFKAGFISITVDLSAEPRAVLLSVS